MSPETCKAAFPYQGAVTLHVSRGVTFLKVLFLLFRTSEYTGFPEVPQCSEASADKIPSHHVQNDRPEEGQTIRTTPGVHEAAPEGWFGKFVCFEAAI